MTLSMVEVAYRLLKEAGTAQHYNDLVRSAVTRGLINTQGLTPEKSLVAAISRENSQRLQRGESLRFDSLGDGYYGLLEWKPLGIERRIQELNRQTRQELHDRISKMPPALFEKLIGELLIALGFDDNTVQVTGRSGDGGIDVVGVMDIEGVTRIDVAVQVKRVARNIVPEKIRALRGSLMPNQRGIFITTSDFTSLAEQESQSAGKVPISLVNGEQLLDLLFRHQIGVVSQQHTVYELAADYWAEIPTATPTMTSIQNNRTSSKQIRIEYPLAIFARYHGAQIEAMLIEDGQVIIGNENYGSVSSAGMAVTGWKSCNGWRFWLFTSPIDGREYLVDVLRRPDN